MVAKPMSDVWIINADVPDELRPDEVPLNGRLAIQIVNGEIVAVVETENAPSGLENAIDADGGIVMSGLVDCHTHLDKAHLSSFFGFQDGMLLDAIKAMEDSKTYWTDADLVTRVRFGLDRAAIHGVRALRSHVDFTPTTPSFVAPTMRALREEAQDRGIIVQLAPLIPLEQVDDEAWLDGVAHEAKGTGGVIGFFVFKHNFDPERLARAFDAAHRHDLMLDFHVDEGLDPELRGLDAIATLALERKPSRSVLCGHNISLSLLPPDELTAVLDRVARARISLVMLPHSNLYLQDRNPNRTPRHRGLMPILEAERRGVNAAIGTDNVRDAFYPYGDHDPLEALALAATAAHLPRPLSSFINSITRFPAYAMELPWDGFIRPGAPAELVVFGGWSIDTVIATLGRPRRVIHRDGRCVDWTTPDHRKLKDTFLAAR